MNLTVTSKILNGKKSFLLFLTLFFTVGVFCQQTSEKKQAKESGKKEWWDPIVQKHQIKTKQFYSFKTVFETGKSLFRNDTMIRMTEATILYNAGEEYFLITAPLAIHNLKKQTIEIKDGLEKMYNKNSSPDKPVQISKLTNYKNDFARNIESCAATTVWRDSTYKSKRYNIEAHKIENNQPNKK